MPALTATRCLSALLKQQPLETCLLIIVPLTLAAVLEIINPAFLSNPKTEISPLVIFFSLLAANGGIVFLFLVAMLSTYLVIKFIGARLTGDLHQLKKIPWLLFSTIYLLVMLSGFSSLSTLIVRYHLFTSSSPGDIASASNSLMNWDYKIFGFYPPLWLQNFARYSWLDTTLILAYGSLALALTSTMFFLAIGSTALFRRFVIALFFALFLSLPFWYALPALTPDEMYRQNILRSTAPADIQTHLYQFSLSSTNLIQHLTTRSLSQPAYHAYAVSSFPSLHASWGIIIAYFCLRLWYPLGLFLVPWSILNLLGTVYTTQHYAVDTLFGVVIAIVAIIFANHVFSQRGQPAPAAAKYFAILSSVQQDVKKLRATLNPSSNFTFPCI